ncbi:MAG: molecular chaperone SurA, partial [Burkholderiales bacterium]
MLRNLILRLAAAAAALPPDRPASTLAATLGLIASLFPAVAPLPAAAQVAVAREVDRVVAVVNSEAITAHELALRTRVAQGQLRAQNIEAPPRDVLEKQVLERMIIDRAQLQAAREVGIRVDEAQVDRALAAIAQENRLSLA